MASRSQFHLPATAATPEALEATVLALRGEWR